MAIPWTVLAMTFLVVATYVAYRWLLLHTVRGTDKMGAYVGWDVNICPSEGGRLKVGESRGIAEVRKIVHSHPQVFFVSNQFVGSETFDSHEIRRLRRLHRVKRLVFDRVPVRYVDLDWLLKRLKIEELLICDVYLSESERKILGSTGRYKFTYETPGDFL